MKATILQVGQVDPLTKAPLSDWVFDCHNSILAIEMLADGTALYAGYTSDELLELQAQAVAHHSRYPSEWPSVIHS